MATMFVFGYKHDEKVHLWCHVEATFSIGQDGYHLKWTRSRMTALSQHYCEAYEEVEPLSWTQIDLYKLAAKNSLYILF